MVGPRGGSPYARRGGNRVSKQQYYQQAIAAQQQQAAAAAASYHQQQQQRQQQQQAVAAVAVVENITKKTSDKLSGGGAPEDKSVAMSLRETAIVRYIRYRELMELIIGTATETPKYVAPSLKSYSSAAPSSESLDDTELSSKSIFYKQATDALRLEFLSKSAHEATESSSHSSESELKSKYGLEICEQHKVQRVACDLGLPEPAKAPPKEILEAQIAKYQEARASKALTDEDVASFIEGRDAEMKDVPSENKQAPLQASADSQRRAPENPSVPTV